MTKTAWVRDGRILVDKHGRIILCDHCPCEEPSSSSGPVLGWECRYCKCETVPMQLRVEVSGCSGWCAELNGTWYPTQRQPTQEGEFCYWHETRRAATFPGPGTTNMAVTVYFDEEGGGGHLWVSLWWYTFFDGAEATTAEVFAHCGGDSETAINCLGFNGFNMPRVGDKGYFHNVHVTISSN